MPLSIKNEDTERLVRKIARLTGESLTDAVRVSVAERYDRLTRTKSGRTLADELNEIALRCASLPVISHLSADDVLGYDESGIPSR
jgi:antitoxin VapB